MYTRPLLQCRRVLLFSSGLCFVYPSILAYRVGQNLLGFGRFNVYCSLIWIGIFPRLNPIQKFLTHDNPINSRFVTLTKWYFKIFLPVIWLASCAHMQGCVFSLIPSSDCFFFSIFVTLLYVALNCLLECLWTVATLLI